jgi:hypothetical protein
MRGVRSALTLVGMPRECQDTEGVLQETTSASVYGQDDEELED